MATVKFKVESGIQLLARLRKRPDIENFYSVLFENGPQQSEIIELYSEKNTSCLLVDIITEALIPAHLGGVNAGVLIISTDGNINFEVLASNLRRKLLSRVTNNSYEQKEFTDEQLQNLLHDCLSNLHILEIYDLTQFYITLHNLDSILIENSNISLMVFHTLTAFYWSEQGFKIAKMDIYLRNLLRTIKKNTKEYKITSLFTRPEYFSSSKDSIEKLERCAELPSLDNVNYLVQVVCKDNGSYEVHVRTFSKLITRSFNIIENEIKWL